jgi:ankyrin repeat protein
VTTENGWTALHLAAENGHVEAVQYLLANGAKRWAQIKAGRRAGYTAKQIAELEKKFEVAAILGDEGS